MIKGDLSSWREGAQPSGRPEFLSTIVVATEAPAALGSPAELPAMTHDVDPVYVFVAVTALLLLVPTVAGGALWLVFRKGGRAIRVIVGSALVALVFAPTFVTVHHYKYGNVHHGPVPATLLEGVIIQADTQDRYSGPEPQSFVSLVVPVAAAWMLLAALGLLRPFRWPERASSIGRLFQLSWVGLLLIPVTVASAIALGAVIGPLLWAGTVTIGWSLLLLYRTRQVTADSPAQLWVVRGWLALCIVAGATSAFVDLALAGFNG
jgi:hypothetical protein